MICIVSLILLFPHDVRVLTPSASNSTVRDGSLLRNGAIVSTGQVCDSQDRCALFWPDNILFQRVLCDETARHVLI